MLSNQYVSFGKLFVFDLTNTWFHICHHGEFHGISESCESILGKHQSHKIGKENELKLLAGLFAGYDIKEET